jgi:hypothetical protein
MFKVGQKVRRNPRIWKNDPTVFTVTRLDNGLIYVQKPGRDECPWTGKLVPFLPMPYLTKELVAA